MQQLSNLVTQFITVQVMPVVVTVILVGLVCAGMGFMAGKKAREWAKEHVLWVIGGAALTYTAASLAPDIARSFGF